MPVRSRLELVAHSMGGEDVAWVAGVPALRESRLRLRITDPPSSPSGRYMSTVAEIEVVALWAPTISTRLVVSNQIGRRQKSLKSLYGLRRNES
jgi:hypothetical protein